MPFVGCSMLKIDFRVRYETVSSAIRPVSINQHVLDVGKSNLAAILQQHGIAQVRSL